MLQTIQNNNLEVLSKDSLTLIDFSASWCGPCRMLAPIFHELAEEQGDTIHFYTADIDQNRQLAQQFAINAVPTIVLLKNGKEITRTTGFLPKEQLKTWIADNQ